MHEHFQGVHRWIGIGGVAASCFAFLVYVGSSGGHVGSVAPPGTALPPLADGIVGGVFVAGAISAAVVSWRRHAGPRTRWVLAAGALVAGQALVVTLLALHSAPPRDVVTLTLMLLGAVAGLGCVVGSLRGLADVGHVVDKSFAIGLGMGLVAAGHLLLQFPISRPPAATVEVLVGVLVATHVAVAALVLRQRSLAPSVAALIVVTVLVVDGGLLLNVFGVTGGAADAAVALARAGVGAAWLTVACVSLRRAIEEDRRRIDSFEHVLVDTTREQRERLHELRSTVAGLVHGSALMDEPDLPEDVRRRLWESVRRELGRMERLLSGKDEPATELDLDEALTMILDLQRLKGRQVELRSTGTTVRARFDALAEVVNILMDNAVTHGRTDRSVVEVVRRDEDTVDITVTDFGRGIPEEHRSQIFAWGKRGSRSPGEGIGLHVAQRLMTEDGGSLQLAEPTGTGSSFVISLPAVRRSQEDLVMGGDSAWRRSS
ncbi:HAMP domain-containing sensor histidine kinase [Nocardioides sp. SYSU D00065]|uniref:sensor histidine kinase n=1 Tax=Nocardioides sp. SYSU D00065 TaxID=2817378 RepID=UPI001B326CB7|nr:HAMP domain-containing sensor histidine kinase [Nocardioides sp. SYSU D00065]